MLYFANDYQEGGHPKLLEALIASNDQQMLGYGTDPYSESARQKIRQACGLSDQAPVYFMSGGTQTNAAVIKGILRPYEGVISATSGHINDHEAGAIETRGHKVLALNHQEGKLEASQVEAYLKAYQDDPNNDHVVRPGMVYISYPSEFGTIYSKAELEALYQVCQDYQIPLYIDGARLGYGLMAEEADLTLEAIAHLCDVLFIGGTKIGALLGEAVVVSNPAVLKGFTQIMKQDGALLAKGRVLGVQFDCLFTDGLYLDISRHAIQMANRLKQALQAKGYDFFIDSPTNQQFVIIDNQQRDQLAREVAFSTWMPDGPDRTVIRLATSWATRAEDVEALINLM
ncbi:threonine aldolase family protein [Hutsoniella sourekii]